MLFKRGPFANICALAKDSAQINLKALDRRMNGVIEQYANNPMHSSISTEGLLVKCLAKAMEVCVQRSMGIPKSELLGTGDGIALAMAMDSWRNEKKYGEEIREEYWAAFYGYDDL